MEDKRRRRSRNSQAAASGPIGGILGAPVQVIECDSTCESFLAAIVFSGLCLIWNRAVLEKYKKCRSLAWNSTSDIRASESVRCPFGVQFSFFSLTHFDPLISEAFS